MIKKNYKYMHTLNYSPAYYVPGEQIVYAAQYVEALCDSVKQIREEQKLSKRWRTKKGFSNDGSKYGYKKIIISTGKEK